MPDRSPLSLDRADITRHGATGRILKELEGHTGEIDSRAFSPDGITLASGARDHTARLWDIADGRARVTIPGGRKWVWTVAFSPGRTDPGAGQRRCTVRFWDVARGRWRAIDRVPADTPVSAVFSPDGKVLATGHKDSAILGRLPE